MKMNKDFFKITNRLPGKFEWIIMVLVIIIVGVLVKCKVDSIIESKVPSYAEPSSNGE